MKEAQKTGLSHNDLMQMVQVQKVYNKNIQRSKQIKLKSTRRWAN